MDAGGRAVRACVRVWRRVCRRRRPRGQRTREEMRACTNTLRRQRQRAAAAAATVRNGSRRRPIGGHRPRRRNKSRFVSCDERTLRTRLYVIIICPCHGRPRTTATATTIPSNTILGGCVGVRRTEKTHSSPVAIFSPPAVPAGYAARVVSFRHRARGDGDARTTKREPRVL